MLSSIYRYALRAYKQREAISTYVPHKAVGMVESGARRTLKQYECLYTLSFY